MKRGIQTKLIATVLVGGLLFLSIGLYLTYTYVKEALTVSIGENFAAIAQKTAEGFDTAVKGEFRDFQILSFDPEFVGAMERRDRSFIEKRLQLYIQHEKEHENEGDIHLALYVLDKRGMVIGAAKMRPGEPTSQGDLPWWKAISETNLGLPYAGNIYRDGPAGRYAFDFAVPVMTPGGKQFLGAIKGVLDSEVFFHFIKEMRFARTGHGMLMSSDGTPLVCSILPLISHSMNRPLVDQIVKGGQGWTIAKDDAHGGKNSIVGFAPVKYLNSLGPGNLGGNQWFAFIRQEPSETFAPVRSLLWKVLLFEGVVIGLVGVFGVAVVRRFVLQPLANLQKGVQELEKGDMDAHVDIQTHDEIEDLAGGFNRMSRALKESYAGLEQKIKNRTGELRASETKYRVLMEQAYDAIFLINPETWQVIEANQQAEKMTGYSKEELLTMNFMDLQPDHEVEPFKKSMRKGHAAFHDVSLRRKDGGNLWVDIRARLVEYNGFKVYHGIVRDMTERKKEEEKMRTANEQLSRSTLVMLEQDQKLSALREEVSLLLRNSGLSEADKERLLRAIQHL